MNKLFLIIFNMTFTTSFIIAAVMITKLSLKKFLTSFVGSRKTNIKGAEEIRHLIDEYREG